MSLRFLVILIVFFGVGVGVLTYVNNSYASGDGVFLGIVSNTEYRPGQEGQVIAVLLRNGSRDFVSGATCRVDVYMPDKSKYVYDGLQSAVSNLMVEYDGSYYLSFPVPDEEGVYEYLVYCDVPGLGTVRSAKSFHVTGWDALEWNSEGPVSVFVGRNATFEWKMPLPTDYRVEEVVCNVQDLDGNVLQGAVFDSPFTEPDGPLKQWVHYGFGSANISSQALHLDNPLISGQFSKVNSTSGFTLFVDDDKPWVFRMKWLPRPCSAGASSTFVFFKNSTGGRFGVYYDWYNQKTYFVNYTGGIVEMPTRWVYIGSMNSSGSGASLCYPGGYYSGGWVDMFFEKINSTTFFHNASFSYKYPSGSYPYVRQYFVYNNWTYSDVSHRAIGNITEIEIRHHKATSGHDGWFDEIYAHWLFGNDYYVDSTSNRFEFSFDVDPSYGFRNGETYVVDCDVRFVNDELSFDDEIKLDSHSFYQWGYFWERDLRQYFTVLSEDDVWGNVGIEAEGVGFGVLNEWVSSGWRVSGGDVVGFSCNVPGNVSFSDGYAEVLWFANASVYKGGDLVEVVCNMSVDFGEFGVFDRVVRQFVRLGGGLKAWIER